ncbi:ABC transporter ATP-binding protein [Desulfococcaceae bacterium HSG8]|nr:ABC transporter ATP-binding protein [Desulfococcaceae bacterium HSG8]
MGHIVVRNLRKEYIDRRRRKRGSKKPDECIGNCVLVLDDISLEFQNGEMICILGPSGCGKSTMLRILAGFDSASSGTVLINGKPVNGPSSDNIFVFQHSSLFPWMTVRQNVELGLRHMEDKADMNEQIQEYIEMVELDGFENRYPYQLSGGMQRRAELARALAVNPDILFMDEPFSGLDFLTHLKMREEVVNMHQFIGKTVVLVTHDVDDALLMGDRIVVLSERPAHLKLARELDFPRPRNYEKMPELNGLRNELFFILGVNYAI